MGMKPLLIIKTGETMPYLSRRRGDFEEWIIRCLDDTFDDITVAAPHKGERLPPIENFYGVIITGSHAMVTDREDWSERTAKWIPDLIADEIPLLGICYGHQLMAHALGGCIGASSIGVEIGTVKVSLRPEAANDPLFHQLPRHILVHASHTQSVIELPPDASLLASGKNELHHAFSIGRAAWGIQFHPEFDADIMNAYIDEFDELIRSSGQDTETLKQNTEDTPISRSILKRFAEIVLQRSFQLKRL
jgi:GMP synthase (glutamine-hydrolysing)